MKRNVLWLITAVATALVQTMWPEFFTVRGVAPDLVLLLVVYFGLVDGEERAMLTGVVGGIYQDVASSAVLGHHVLCAVIVGYAVGRLSTRLITDHPAIRALLVLAAGVMHGVLYTAVSYVQRPDISTVYTIAVVVIPTAFYTALLTPVVYFVLEWIFRKPDSIGGGLK
ncbi:MAG: rod shape-determining protein MreD [Candidatus Hydrogenedens sp.]|nr:rod shape-determining protein MreD [Candidatus Hydrogenedens sp.]